MRQRSQRVRNRPFHPLFAQKSAKFAGAWLTQFISIEGLIDQYGGMGESVFLTLAIEINPVPPRFDVALFRGF